MADITRSPGSGRIFIPPAALERRKESNMTFGGETFDEGRDGDRLRKQSSEVWGLMHDSKWRTLKQISKALGHPEPSVSARLRDFRKAKFGGHIVERRYVSKGLWEYQLIPVVQS